MGRVGVVVALCHDTEGDVLVIKWDAFVGVETA